MFVMTIYAVGFYVYHHCCYMPCSSGNIQMRTLHFLSIPIISGLKHRDKLIHIHGWMEEGGTYGTIGGMKESHHALFDHTATQQKCNLLLLSVAFNTVLLLHIHTSSICFPLCKLLFCMMHWLVMTYISKTLQQTRNRNKHNAD